MTINARTSENDWISFYIYVDVDFPHFCNFIHRILHHDKSVERLMANLYFAFAHEHCIIISFNRGRLGNDTLSRGGGGGGQEVFL